MDHPTFTAIKWTSTALTLLSSNFITSVAVNFMVEGIVWFVVVHGCTIYRITSIEWIALATYRNITTVPGLNFPCLSCLSFLFNFSSPLYLMHKPLAQQLRLTNQLPTQTSRFMTIYERIPMRVNLREDCTELKVKFALVTEFMQFCS